MAQSQVTPRPQPSDDPSTRKKHVPPPLNHDQMLRNPHNLDLDFGGRVLLSPPVEPLHALAAVKTESPEAICVSDADFVSNHNYNAFTANLQYAASRFQDAGGDASTLLDGLHIRTDIVPPRRSGSSYSFESDSRLRQSASASSLPRRMPSIRTALHSTAGSLSPGSVISSPQLAAMLDMTPLPSPTLTAHDPWKIVVKSRSRGSSFASRSDAPIFTFPSSLSPTSPSRRKLYHGLRPTSENLTKSESGQTTLDDDKDPRTRSVSDYIPEAIMVPKPRNIAVSSTGPLIESTIAQANMQREEYLGVTRGLVTPVAGPSTPQGAVHGYLSKPGNDEPSPKRAKIEIFTAQSIARKQERRYTSIKDLGQGTFSKVYLAVRQIDGENDTTDYTRATTNMAGIRQRLKRLVAVKVVEPGPAGGADADRIETSLQREVEILKAVKHPSVVHLKAFGMSESGQALLVMNYCAGGDLFEVASTKPDILVPSLIRRIFSELVSAVRHLHQKYIVHRDIKLENVLLNIPVQVHPDVRDWQTLDRAVVTLTDLGLSRRIPEPPESPMLETRCGSEDYAAPELLMGQSYDGRQTDAWALGVLLYALMEGRLPFDPLPGARGDPAVLRARTPHRIARCEWAWYKYGDEDGDWDVTKAKGIEGAFKCVDGLLKRVSRRKPLEEIRELPWVRDGIQVDGGLMWADEESL